MKIIATGVAFLFSFSAWASCPDFSGSYFREGEGGEPVQLKVTTVVENEIASYELQKIYADGEIISAVVADGIKRIEKEDSYYFEETTTCVNDEVVTVYFEEFKDFVTGDVYRNAGTARLSLDTDGNFIEMTVGKSTGGPYDERIVWTPVAK